MKNLRKYESFFDHDLSYSNIDKGSIINLNDAKKIQISNKIKETVANDPTIRTAISKLDLEQKIQFLTELNNFKKTMNENLDEKTARFGKIISRFGIALTVVAGLCAPFTAGTSLFWVLPAITGIIWGIGDSIQGMED